MDYSPDKPVYKAGSQSEENPYTFVMSDESVDRAGDIIRVNGWDLDQFRKNPVALFGHDHNSIVGVWNNVRIEGKRLLGDLKLAAEGTSELVDTTRKLIEQRILKAVSVGFMPVEATPRKTGGLDFTKTILHECSVVAVPCNANALAIAKTAYSPEVADIIFTRVGLSDGDDGEPLSRLADLTTPNLDAARERAKALGIK